MAGANTKASGTGCGLGSEGSREFHRTGKSVSAASSPTCASNHRATVGVSVMANRHPRRANGSTNPARNHPSTPPAADTTTPNTGRPLTKAP
nr:hypothetical protein GCM10017745_31100 [Saccharothrix mutabilis subsp. capreolus]